MFYVSVNGLQYVIQNETGISVRDRIGFACTFLSDLHLNDYIDQLSRHLIREGNLDGILLTGICNKVISISLD